MHRKQIAPNLSWFLKWQFEYCRKHWKTTFILGLRRELAGQRAYITTVDTEQSFSIPENRQDYLNSLCRLITAENKWQFQDIAEFCYCSVTQLL